MAEAPNCNTPALKLTKVVTNPNAPLFLAQPPGDTSRLYVVERRGRIVTYAPGQTMADTFLDMRNSVAQPSGENEYGLLGLAFHPQYATNGRFFVFYNRSNNDPFSTGSFAAMVVAEGKRSSTPTKAETTLKTIFKADQENDYHNGGFMAFGPDGLLYFGLGEDGRDGYKIAPKTPDQRMKPGVSADPSSPIGKLHRINVDQPTAKVPGNFDAANALPSVWVVGMRNPYRGSIDQKTGDVWIGDVGEASWEEVTRIPANTKNGYAGWGQAEGRHCFPWFHPYECKVETEIPGSLLPVHEYFHEGANVMSDPMSYMGQGKACTGGYNRDDPGSAAADSCARAVIGGYVYRGKKIAGLVGRYVYGDLVKNWVKSFAVKDGVATCEFDHTPTLRTAATPIRGLISFSEDAEGELYLIDFFGQIYRIDPA